MSIMAVGPCRINAYETSLRRGTTQEQKEKGIEGKEFLQALIEDKPVFIQTFKGKEQGKYGRYLAEIYISEVPPNFDPFGKPLIETTLADKSILEAYKKASVDGLVCLNDIMVAKGYAIYQKY